MLIFLCTSAFEKCHCFYYPQVAVLVGSEINLGSWFQHFLVKEIDEKRYSQNTLHTIRENNCFTKFLFPLYMSVPIIYIQGFSLRQKVKFYVAPRQKKKKGGCCALQPKTLCLRDSPLLTPFCFLTDSYGEIHTQRCIMKSCPTVIIRIASDENCRILPWKEIHWILAKRPRSDHEKK